MFVVATTRRNASPSLILELLSRVARVVKDYCGALTEDALRKNAILVYELLDEMLDHGYAQSTNTDSLKHRVHNEPAAVFSAAEKTHRANAANPVANPIAATVFAGVSAAMSTSGARGAHAAPRAAAALHGRLDGRGRGRSDPARDVRARSGRERRAHVARRESEVLLLAHGHAGLHGDHGRFDLRANATEL